MKTKTLVRKNMQKLKPYKSARENYSGEGYTMLDANENNFWDDFNTYPDPNQHEVKEVLAQMKNVDPGNIILGNGSGELIDLAMRCFCEPQHDEILTIEPTFGLYSVCAKIQNVNLKTAPLDNSFQFSKQALLQSIRKKTKLIIICSPNNPTGNAFLLNDLIDIVRSFQGIVIIDEAYIDFCQEKSTLPWIKHLPNLIVLQTFSKAWGMAGLRLGAGYGDAKLIHVLNKAKLPYTVNSFVQKVFLEQAKNKKLVHQRIQKIISEREKLRSFLVQLGFIKNVFYSDANFLLVEVNDASNLYGFLKYKKILIRKIILRRKRNSFLRISIGNETENKQLMNALNMYAYEKIGFNQ